VFELVKDNSFEDKNWKECSLDDLKVPFEMTDEAKRNWLLLVVIYSRHLWGHLTYVGGRIGKRDNLHILQNFISYK
jgi:hypothetical protein